MANDLHGDAIDGVQGLPCHDLFGLAVGQLVHASASGAYTLVGMAASVAATTHAPLMAAVFVFEVSGDYALVLPLLVATGISSVVSRRLSPDSIYEAEAKRG